AKLKASRVVVAMPLGDGQLLHGHVHTDDPALFSDELGEQKGIPPRTAAKVEHGGALQRKRNGRAAAVELLSDFVMQRGLDRAQIGRKALCRTAGAGLEVRAPLQHTTVIFFDDLDGTVSAHDWLLPAGHDSTFSVRRTGRARLPSRPSWL